MNRYFLIFLLCISVVGFAKGQDTIPFKLNDHYNILVKALINEMDSADLMFQISMQEASLSPNRERKMSSVKFDTTEFPEGLSKVNRIQVAGVTVDSIWIWDNELTGYGAEGKIGLKMFQNKVFKMDFDASQFVLYDALPDTGWYRKLPLKLNRGQLFVEASSRSGEKEQTDEYLLQSGFSGAVLYNQNISHDLQLTGLPIIEKKVMKNSSGKEVHNMIAVLSSFEISDFQFNEVPVNFFVGDGFKQLSNYLGADMIHRFNWIIDIKGGYAYIQKNKNFEDPYYFGKKSG